MRLGEGVEWALHCCTVLAMLGPDQAIPAARLAEFHGVPPAYLAKHLQQLSRDGIVESVPGRRGGYRLARAPGDITLLQVVEAVEGRERAFQCAEIRRRGPAAVDPDLYAPVCGIARSMWKAEAAWRRELATQTIGDVLVAMGREVPSEAAAKGAAWFQEVVR